MEDWICAVCFGYHGEFRNSCKYCGMSRDGKNQEQRFEKDYYLVMDFEANCSNENTRDHEIIEFPAVLINARTGETVAEFQQYVKMISHKQLSTFIKSLTHITDEQVKNGSDWQACLDSFEEWCYKNGITCDNTTVVTCGNWDLETMLHNQLNITKTKLSKFLNDLFGCWTDVKVYFIRYTKKKAHGMAGMLNQLNIELSGHHHSGIDDSRNTAKICHELTKMGADVTTPTKIRTQTFWYPDHRLSWKINKVGFIVKC